MPPPPLLIQSPRCCDSGLLQETAQSFVTANNPLPTASFLCMDHPARIGPQCCISPLGIVCLASWRLFVPVSWDQLINANIYKKMNTLHNLQVFLHFFFAVSTLCIFAFPLLPTTKSYNPPPRGEKYEEILNCQNHAVCKKNSTSHGNPSILHEIIEGVPEQYSFIGEGFWECG